MLDSELAASAEEESMGSGEDELFPDDGAEDPDSEALNDFAEVGPPPEEPDTLHAPGPRYLDLARHEGGTPGAGMGFEPLDAPVMAQLIGATAEDISQLEEEDLLGIGDALRSDKLGIKG